MAILRNETSAEITHTYIFPEFVARQPKLPDGFPQEWKGAKTIDADYEMDPQVISSPDYSQLITDAFESLPSLSLSMETSEWFNHETGVYVGYPNTHEIREKPVTAEFIFNNPSGKSFAVECGVQNQGGSSIVKWKSPKQSMRLLFKEKYGPNRLRYKLFKDSEINSINTLVVDAMLNATWIHPSDDNQRLHAMYLRDQLTSDLHNNMGALSFHGRYFNIYLNGLYWGICNLHERPDDAFLSEYLDAEREDFDVVKHGPDEVVSGNNLSYLRLLDKARKGFQDYESLESFKMDLDLPAFIDYMILNFYVGNWDWAQHNFYAAKSRNGGSGYRFYTWDSEHVMRFLDVDYDNTGKNDEGAPTEIHTFLKENEEYRMMFADAVYKHLFNDGALTPENLEKSFRARAGEIEQAIILESARWGDYREKTSGVTYTKNDFWVKEVNNALEKYIPHRRDIVIQQFRRSKNKLFPSVMPPKIEIRADSNGKSIVTITKEKADGVIYYSLDGTDPRLVGGSISGEKFTGEITVGKTSRLKARVFEAGSKTWSALAEEIVIMDDVPVAGVTINEIMYHPAEGWPEFIELMNFGEEPVDVNGFQLSGGISFNFNSPHILEPGKGIVLTDDVGLFYDSYGFSAFRQYQKKLSNKGEVVFLQNGFGQLVDSVFYSDSIPWPESADGSGFSLELKSGVLDNSLWSSWKPSEQIYGSPFTDEVAQEIEAQLYPNPFSDKVTVNLSSFGLAEEIDAIEIFNNTGQKIKTVRINRSYPEIEIDLLGIPPGMYLLKVNPKNTAIFEGAVLKAVKLGN